MKFVVLSLSVLLIATLTACEPSGTAKKEMEKFSGTPTPTFAPTPVQIPIDPALIVQVDTSLDGERLSVNGDQQKKTVDCSKFNQLLVNGDRNTVTVKGVCRNITINGDGNQLTAEAAMEFVFNGSDNKLTYRRFPNGKRPSVVENRPGNTVEQVSATK